MSPTTPQYITVPLIINGLSNRILDTEIETLERTIPLIINALSNRILDTEIETLESADYSDISHCK